MAGGLVVRHQKQNSRVLKPNEITVMTDLVLLQRRQRGK